MNETHYRRTTRASGRGTNVGFAGGPGPLEGTYEFCWTADPAGRLGWSWRRNDWREGYAIGVNQRQRYEVLTAMKDRQIVTAVP